MKFPVKRISDTFVGEVKGINLADDHDEDAIASIRAALLDYGVLIFRGQKMSNEEHVRFSQKFGPSEFHPVTQYLLPEFPEILVLANRGYEGTKPIANGGAYWHSDMTYKAKPPMGSILYALEVPPEGGDTMYCDMAAAYEHLSNEIKQKIEGLKAAHSYLPRFIASREIDDEFQNNKFELSDNQKAELTEVIHPVVRAHSENNRRALFINEGFTIRIDGMAKKESKALLANLNDHATNRRFVYTHKWSVGDVIFWDNRVTMHKATEYNLQYSRRMHRTTIRGDTPT
tara:strand:- start:50 stop:910 length:861 start_codon:yes stop_codon:yes gene_type:complete